MSMRKEGDVSVQCAKPNEESIGTNRYLPRHLTSGTSVAEEVPVWTCLMDVQRVLAFVIAIIPFR